MSHTYTDFSDFKGVPATIRWFDNLSGEGMVRMPDGKCYYLHYSAVEGSGRDVWVSFPDEDNIPCEVELLDDDFTKMVRRLRCNQTIVVPRVYSGRCLWFDERDGYGVIEANSGHEFYVDTSVLPGRQPLKRDQRVKFQINTKISHCRCACAVEVLP